MKPMAEAAESLALGGPRRLDDADDEELVAGIARGNEEALGEVYRRHAGHVFALATDATGGIYLAGAVLHAVFLALWEEPARFGSGPGSLRCLLLAEATGAARRSRCAAVLGSLPDDEQEVLELACWKGHSSSEIAEKLQLREATVASRIGWGLKRLALAMSDPARRGRD